MSAPQYEYRTEPMEHQRLAIELRTDQEAWAHFWQMGTGKAKLGIDTMSRLYEEEKIDGAVVFAPNACISNWAIDEIPKHMPERVLQRAWIVSFDSKTCRNKTTTAERARLLQFQGLAILLMPYSAVTTDVGKKYLKTFCKERRVIGMLDESQYIKNPGSKRTRTVRASGVYMRYRRCYSGTPITAAPDDYYAQIAFLDPEFWKRKGINNHVEFQAYFNTFNKVRTADGGWRALPREAIQYRNMEQLRDWVAEVSDRVLKSEVLDLPPITYTKRYFQLAPSQRELYREVRTKVRAELEESGWKVPTVYATQKLLRLHQITCGYIGVERVDVDSSGLRHKKHRLELLADNARLDCAKEELIDLTCQGIVWCWYKQDVNAIVKALHGRCRRFDGEVSDEDRTLARHAFQAGDVQWLVINTRMGAEGLTLTNAEVMAYYTNGDDLGKREQSESRAHRRGLRHPVTVMDFVAEGTVDEKIVDSMQRKQALADLLTGDSLRQWTSLDGA